MSLPSHTFRSFSDEMTKISADKERTALKRWLKNTSLIAAGSGAGVGASMLAERAMKTYAGPKWRSLSPQVRVLIAAPVAAASSIGASILARKLEEERQKR